ncbi:tyrosine-type recombinase/integrase [Paraburkholderia panacisoli]|uniref:tyrosine-type recombinase/integrase n=1 Tax=Paraburkholderia panacisoli TaxID=2603818 RepID=UPI001FE5C780|nr:tyrosine-type recombinase/integrase [Paraburkholderia panacisoli]
MNTLREAVQSYLALRRGLGFKLLLAGNALQDFVTFMEKRRAVHITLRRVLQWAQQPKHAQLATWAARLGYVRGFAQYYSAFDPHTEIPPCALMPYRPRRAKPYLYSSEEIETLLQAALTLSGGMGLRPWTYYCFFGLLSVSGLRLGEALDLTREDVDLKEGIMTVRGKFGKIRMVPLHESTRQVLAAYVTRRERFLAGRSAPHLFVSSTLNPLHRAEVYRTFHSLSRQIGLRSPTATHGPRLHDFRHRFATETLLQWYRNGEDVERR